MNTTLKSINGTIVSERRRTDRNQEDVTIVCLSKNNNILQEPLFLITLRTINDYIQVFHEEVETLAYIESVSEEKILLIVDYLSNSFFKALEALNKVDYVLAYVSESPGELPPIITAICPTHQQLVDEIKFTRQQIDKQMIFFSLYNQRKTEKFDLSHESSSFLFFQLFKIAFKRLPKNSESKKLMLSKCLNYYAGNSKVLEQMKNFEHKYKSNEALRWYTHDSFIYRLVNKALRTENISALCYFHFYINDLSIQLEREFSQFKKQNSKAVIQFYRGFKTTPEEIKRYERNIGNLFLTNGYLSATLRRQLAYRFATRQDRKLDEEKVLFEFTVDLTLIKSIVFADISQYNESPEENEILFDLGTVFKINSCMYSSEECLWLVNVIATDEGVNVASEYVEYQATKMADSNIILTFGNLIIDMGDYDKAEKYFDAILHSSYPNDEEISCIYYNIGRVYRLKGEYRRALEYLTQAYRTHSEARPARLVSAAKAMNAIGILHMEQNDVQLAINSFEYALKLYVKTIGEYHPDIAGTLINLGNIYCEQGQFDNALSCFKQAQRIYECHLPSNHPNRAILLNNLGNLYYLQRQFDLALSSYQKAWDINEKILPSNHPEIVRNRHNLSMIHTIIADQNKTNSELKQSSKISVLITQTTLGSIQTNPFPKEVIYSNESSEPKSESIEMDSF